MTRKNNKKCILCGKVYSYCSRCSEYDDLPRWMEIYCGENCRKIFRALTEYCCQSITADEAAKILDSCDLSDYEKYHDVNKELIDEIKNGGMKVEKEKLKADTDDLKVDTVDSQVLNNNIEITETTANNTDNTINANTSSNNNYNKNKQNRIKYSKRK